MPRVLTTRPSERLLEALPPSDLLLRLGTDVQERLRHHLIFISLEAGETLFDEGDSGDALYRLVTGRLEVLKTIDGTLERIAEIQPGDWVGELSLLTGDPRRATVRAHRDAVLARLDVSDVRDLMQSSADFLGGLARLAIRRLDRAPAAEATPRVIAVVPASRGKIGAFARALSLALESAGRVQLIDGGMSRARHEDDAPIEEITAWLDDLEAASDILVLLAEADADGDRWRDVAVRNADLILLVAPISGMPLSPPRVGKHARVELVLLHADYASIPRGTAPWLDRYAVEAHHHVRIGRPRDVERVARRITRRAVGLVLSGGAGRGVAHIGVLQALEEEGIPVDAVTGTSMGAIVGALIAMGFSADEVYQQAKRAWVTEASFDLTIPWVSLARGRVFRRSLQRMFQGVSIEDLWHPFACVATSLARADKVIIDRGRVRDAVYASSALPGLFPPAQLDGDMLVDGAFVDNLPAELCRELGAGRLIAVNVLPAVDPVFVRPRRRRRLRARLQAFNPYSPDRRPLITDIVNRAYFVPTVLAADSVRATADLFIEPGVETFAFADMREDTFEAIYLAGYHETLRVLRSARIAGEHWFDPGTPM